MEHQHAAAQAVAAHLEAGPASRERIEARRPLAADWWLQGGHRKNAAIRIRGHFLIVALAVVEHDLEHPARVAEVRRGYMGLAEAGLGRVDEQRLSVAVADGFQIAVCGAHAIALVDLGEIDVVVVLGDVLIDDCVALVVVALTDQPTEDVAWVGRVGDARFGRAAVDREDVVFRDRAPVGVAIGDARPAFDAGEQSLDAGPVAFDQVAVARLFVEDHLSLLIASPVAIWIFLVDRDQVLGTGEDVDI